MCDRTAEFRECVFEWSRQRHVSVSPLLFGGAAKLPSSQNAFLLAALQIERTIQKERRFLHQHCDDYLNVHKYLKERPSLSSGSGSGSGRGRGSASVSSDVDGDGDVSERGVRISTTLDRDELEISVKEFLTLSKEKIVELESKLEEEKELLSLLPDDEEKQNEADEQLMQLFFGEEDAQQLKQIEKSKKERELKKNQQQQKNKKQSKNSPFSDFCLNSSIHSHHCLIVKSLYSSLQSLGETMQMMNVLRQTELKKDAQKFQWKRKDLPISSSSSSSTSAAAAAASNSAIQFQEEKSNSNSSSSFDSSSVEKLSSLSSSDQLLLQEENTVLQNYFSSELELSTENEARLQEISSLISLFTNKVSEQEETISLIHKNAIDATIHVEKGLGHLKNATKSNSTYRIFVLMTLLVLSFSLLFLDWYYG